MPLELNICVARKFDATKLFGTDETGIGETGYGGDNPNRSQFAGVWFTQYQPYNKDIVDLGVLVDYDSEYDNDHISKFEVDYHRDGWYLFTYSLVPISAAQEIDNIYYDTTLEALRQWGGEAWVELYNFEALKDSSKYVTTTLNDLIPVRLYRHRDKLLNDWTTRFQDSSNNRDAYDAARKLDLQLKNAEAKFLSFNRNEAQKQIELIAKYYNVR